MVMYQGLLVRRSTGTADKWLAEAIFGQVKVQIIEGRFFEKPTEPQRTDVHGTDGSVYQ